MKTISILFGLAFVALLAEAKPRGRSAGTISIPLTKHFVSGDKNDNFGYQLLKRKYPIDESRAPIPVPLTNNLNVMSHFENFLTRENWTSNLKYCFLISRLNTTVQFNSEHQLKPFKSFLTLAQVICG